MSIPQQWVIACQVVLDVGLGNDVRTGGRPELGFAVVQNAKTFATEDEARRIHRELNLPLGWVIMPLSQFLDIEA